MVVALETVVESSEIAGLKERRSSPRKEISDALKNQLIFGGSKLRGFDAITAKQGISYLPKDAPDLEDSTVYKPRNRIKSSVDESQFLPEEKKSALPNFSYLGSGVKQHCKQEGSEPASSIEARKGTMSALEFRHAVRHAIAQSVLRTGERLPPEDKERAVHKLLCEPGAVTLLKYEERTGDVRNQDYSISTVSWN